MLSLRGFGDHGKLAKTTSNGSTLQMQDQKMEHQKRTKAGKWGTENEVTKWNMYDWNMQYQHPIGPSQQQTVDAFGGQCASVYVYTVNTV